MAPSMLLHTRRFHTWFWVMRGTDSTMKPTMGINNMIPSLAQILNFWGAAFELDLEVPLVSSSGFTETTCEWLVLISNADLFAVSNPSERKQQSGHTKTN